MVKRIVGVLVVSVVMSCSGATAPPVFDGGSPVDAPTVLDGASPIDAPTVLDGASVVDAPTVLDRASPVDAQLPPGPGAVGAMCNANSDCNSMLCLSNRRCSRTCAGQADCISGWTCAPLPGVGNLCQCTIGAEVCDGQDNDCNGLIDDGASCSGNRVCQAGACACPAERRTCGSDCVDPSNDAANCGACGTACGTGGSCVAGACTCPGSMGRACGGACRDLSNDAANCGACGTACGTGGSCVAGACCPGSMGRACGGVCRDLSNDAANCGACGNACGTGQSCRMGACVSLCPAGMAFIPAGSFLMGDADTASYQAQPPHMVTLAAYCMDLTEVTVAAYRLCTAPGCTTPDTDSSCNSGVMSRDNHPINCVDWNQSRAYCQSRGGDLPTEAQWEYAARGTDGRIYPWGNDAPASQLCWSRSSTCAVQSYPSGNSPFGLFDMAGNVWEWTRDFYASYPSAASIDPTGPTSGRFRVYRGGSWNNATATLVRAAYRYDNSPSLRHNFRGFRCARGAM